MSWARSCTAVVAFALGIAGCTPTYGGLRIRKISGEGQATDEHVSVLHGHMMLIEVKPVSTNPFEDYERFDIVDLLSDNVDLVLVRPAPQLEQFVVGGRRPGQSGAEVVVNNDRVGTLAISVVTEGEF